MSQSLIAISENKVKGINECYSFNEIIQMSAGTLLDMCFEIDSGNDFVNYVQVKKKVYRLDDQERVMVQIIDISQTVMYEKVNAENEFLAITNATVSHELRNPLQSISSQNLKVKLCLKELLNIINTNLSLKVKDIEPKLKEILEMITQSYKIQDSSSNLMSFLVDDLLDFAQINNGKFRKVCKEFDLREAIEEVVQIQQQKAMMQGISLKAKFKPQEPGQVISMFNPK